LMRGIEQNTPDGPADVFRGVNQGAVDIE
jgi:hypothetical protein